MPEFIPFPKIARLSREIIVTEKIDGTNAVIHVAEDGTVTAGGRNGWLTPEADSFGFAAWVRDNANDLRNLGPGYHHGEWWGKNIQRNYGLDDRRFSLFNTSRWGNDRPECCRVVPVLARGLFDTELINQALNSLRVLGSMAAPGFGRPEGIVIYHTAADLYFKKTILKDEEWKGKQP